MKTRFIQEIGTRATLRVYWGDDCPDCGGWGSKGYHNAHAPLMDSEKLGDWELGGKPEDYPADHWPTKCDHCGAPVPSKESGIEVSYQVFHKRLYNTDSGSPEPGDVYFVPWYHGEYKEHYCPWDNCDDPRGHLMVVLPNGHEWDTDSRANNCTRKEDRTHRCWVRHGEPPNIHVDKNGDTCSAGAGSIIGGDWHGFLHNGELVKC